MKLTLAATVLLTLLFLSPLLHQFSLYLETGRLPRAFPSSIRFLISVAAAYAASAWWARWRLQRNRPGSEQTGTP